MKQQSQNQDPFSRVMEFFDRFGAPAEGFGRSELSDDAKSQLERLARGELADGERASLIPLLMQNELAMEYLVKAGS